MTREKQQNNRHSLAQLRRAVRLELRATHAGQQYCWLMVDLSAGGFLVQAASPPPVGSRFDFSIVTEELEVEGVGKVVRHEMRDGRAVGFAARFAAVQGEGRRHIARLLRNP